MVSGSDRWVSENVEGGRRKYFNVMRALIAAVGTFLDIALAHSQRRALNIVAEAHHTLLHFISKEGISSESAL
jgi:hypothetical protein